MLAMHEPNAVTIKLFDKVVHKAVADFLPRCRILMNSTKHRVLRSCLTSNWYRHLANFFKI